MNNTKPTRPGRWWAIHRDGVGPDRDPKIVWRMGDESDRDWTWLAPIPSPAVCEALAAYKAAVDARDGEEEARVRRIREGGGNSATVLEELVEEVEYRAEMLADAIRAERNSAA